MTWFPRWMRINLLPIALILCAVPFLGCSKGPEDKSLWQEVYGKKPPYYGKLHEMKKTAQPNE